MARCAIDPEGGFTARRIARGWGGIGRRIGAIEDAGTAPSRADPLGDDVDLLIGEQPAGTRGKCRHGSAADSASDSFANGNVIDNTEIDRVGKSDGGASAAAVAVASSAVVGVQSCEIHNLVWRQGLRTGVRLSRRSAAPRQQERRESGKWEKAAEGVHGRSPRGGIIPGASTPARMAKATFSRVGTLGCRTTTNPATTPKATCEAMNQNQSMWLSRSGFKRDSMEYSSPDHSTGPIKPPSRMGRLANIGSMAPYSSPTAADTSTCRSKATAKASG